MTQHVRAHAHFIGIGGIGMSAIAQVLLRRGWRVSGTDAREGAMIDKLKRLGAEVAIGHHPRHLVGRPVVVYSSAISYDNPERLAARSRGLTQVRRATMLARAMEGSTGIVISGTHGKTTTTAMAALIFTEAGLDPTVVIGGELEALGGNARGGGGPHFIAEGDESDGSLVELQTKYGILTNIEEEHIGYFQDLDEIVEVFRTFVSRIPTDGLLYYAAEDRVLPRAVQGAACRTVGYGFGENAEIRASDVRPEGFGSSFELEVEKHNLGTIHLRVPGRHNVLNSLGPIALALECGASLDKIRAALQQFRGVARRFEVVGQIDDILVVDDYAHHPSEIRATLACARGIDPSRRVLGVFQPHRYSRTLHLHEHFSDAFEDCDELLLTDIYSAFEEPLAGVDGTMIRDAVVRHGRPPVRYFDTLQALGDALLDTVRPGDLVVTMGAGDIHTIATGLVEKLREKQAHVQ
ncbi:MAG: UDP-N-acetylmuramate--L-alanine ligase [Verrucomicrobia bacterium]|nr:UDP-N-acetylmuramate--L-alanine ligase [Verrucomicrobiota bacterium]